MAQQTGTPEEQGVPSDAIKNLVIKLSEHQLAMHSLLIARHGVLIAEIYYKPYTKDTLHRMYSATKSFVSLAIGLLIEDGKLSLNDHICQFFPEYVSPPLHPWLEQMTIGDMLRMETCHTEATFREDDETYNWSESFFKTLPAKPPGALFQYDTSATHVLSALVEKMTGKELIAFLRERFLDDIGFSKQAWIMKDPYGVSKGGSGLMALPRDMLRVGLMIAGEGRHPDDYGKKNGRIVYPPAYLKEATRLQTTTWINQYTGYMCGYGYQFWMLPNDAYTMFGMAGQEVMVFPKEDIVIVTTADTQEVPKGNDVLYSDIVTCLLEHIEDQPLLRTADMKDFADFCSSQTLPVMQGINAPSMQEQVNGRQFVVENKDSGFTGLELHFCDDEGLFIYHNTYGSFKLPFGMGGLKESKFSQHGWRAVSSGAWLSEREFAIHIWVIDIKISSIQVKFSFTDSGRLTVLMNKTEKGTFHEWSGILNCSLKSYE
ncbi:MAG: beta-lactamase family protein [Lachnospiraceae bacterium]|nr:beta-lactamase family protein [Lachnospiraceae bacterium]